jgi:hypothetical protein
MAIGELANVDMFPNQLSMENCLHLYTIGLFFLPLLGITLLLRNRISEGSYNGYLKALRVLSLSSLQYYGCYQLPILLPTRDNN